MVPPITLPVVTVQHDMLDVISDVDSGAAAMEDIWVSCYKAGEPSIHGKVRVSLDEADRSAVRLECRDGVTLHSVDKVSAHASIMSVKIADSHKVRI
jgi:proteasomal ATPase-associated factor 1